jgi:hypothetical protein
VRIRGLYHTSLLKFNARAIRVARWLPDEIFEVCSTYFQLNNTGKTFWELYKSLRTSDFYNCSRNTLLLWNSMPHNKMPLLHNTLCQFNVVHIFTTNICQVKFTIIIYLFPAFPCGLFLRVFLTKTVYKFLEFSFVLHDINFLRGVKRVWGVMLTTHPLLVPKLRKSGSYTSSHTKRLHGV